MPGRRRALLSGDDEDAPAKPAGGSTLFERMANLSRGGRAAPAADAEDEDGDDSSALSIPRFLGRQNNQ